MPGPHESEGSSSARKRKRGEYAEYGYQPSNTRTLKPRGSSRDLMPPPLPNFRPPRCAALPPEQSSASQPARLAPEPAQSIHLYEGQTWDPMQEDARQQLGDWQEHLQNHSNSQVHRELLFRQSPVPIGQPRKLDHLYLPVETQNQWTQFGSRQSTANNASNAQSFAQLSLQSPHHQQGPLYMPTENDRSNEHESQLVKHDRGPGVTQYDLAYGTVAGQANYQARPQLPAFSESYQNLQSPFTAPIRDPHAPHSPQKTSHAPAPSGFSPFFKHDSAAQRPPTVQRPPTRGSFVRPQYAGRTRESGIERRKTQTDTVAAQRYNEPRSLNGLSFIDKPHRPGDYQSLYQSPSYRQEETCQSQRPFMVPQTPRNSQGLFQRPDRLPAPASYASSRAQSNIQRRLQSLPHSHGPPVPFNGSQDQELSQVRGVRGVSSQRGMSSYQRPAPMYDKPRTVFSSAGGRRSVRR